MTAVHLDTNAVIALINGMPPLVRHRLRDARQDGRDICISAIVLHELWFGVAKSARRAVNTETLARFLESDVIVLPFKPDDARTTADIRDALRRAGTPIGPYDILIAGHALQLDATLVTNNTRAFARVPGLRLEDWSQ